MSASAPFFSSSWLMLMAPWLQAHHHGKVVVGAAGGCHGIHLLHRVMLDGHLGAGVVGLHLSAGGVVSFTSRRGQALSKRQ